MDAEGRIDRRTSVPIVMPELKLLAGGERSLLALARWLHRHGHASHLVTYVDCNFAQYADFPLAIADLRAGGALLTRIWALRKYFAEQPADSPVPIVSGYQAALHAVLAGVKSFHCLMHDTHALFATEGKQGWIQRLRIWVSNKIIGFGMRRGGGRMIVTSEFLQRDCLVQFSVHAEIARMGGLNHPDFRRREVGDELRMLSVCRVEANKRIDWILDALAEMEMAEIPLSARIDWRFDQAGSGLLLDAMRARASELGLADRVHFHGFVSDEDLDSLYSQTHLFLMPAVQGYGIPAIEALQRGIPVLVHRDSGVSDILLDTPWAWVMQGGRDQMRPVLESMVEYLVANRQMQDEAAPELPTESAWAERVASLCGYV